MLPEIQVGGDDESFKFYDMSNLVTNDRYQRNTTDGLAIHHSVGADYAGKTMEQEIEHIKYINQLHIELEYGGFGYNGIAFRSGRVYVIGQGGGGRAHVANHNGHLEGICMAGTYTNNYPALGLQLGVGRWLRAKFTQRGLLPVKPHREWVTDPKWATSCCGDAGVETIPNMLKVAAALENAPKELDKKVHEAVYGALNSTIKVNPINFDLLSAQIKFLTGGQYC